MIFLFDYKKVFNYNRLYKINNSIVGDFMKIIDNINKTMKDDLIKEIKKNSKISIASACFSIYAYQELKKQLDNIEQLRFIFTSPTFIKEKVEKEKREFYIPRLSREKSLYGTEFEVKLRNELTQKSIAKECTEWIKEKVIFKSNTTNENMAGFMNIETKDKKITKEARIKRLLKKQGKYFLKQKIYYLDLQDIIKNRYHIDK